MTDPRQSHDDYLDAHRELLAKRADQLAATVSALHNAVAGLDERATGIEERANAAESKADDGVRANRRAIIAIGVVAVFVVVGGWLISQNLRNIHRIDHLVTQVQAEQDQGLQLRQLGVCPVFQTVIVSDSLAAKNSFPAGPAAHDRLISNLRKAVEIMKCEPLDAPTAPTSPGGH